MSELRDIPLYILWDLSEFYRNPIFHQLVFYCKLIILIVSFQFFTPFEVASTTIFPPYSSACMIRVSYFDYFIILH